MLNFLCLYFYLFSLAQKNPKQNKNGVKNQNQNNAKREREKQKQKIAHTLLYDVLFLKMNSYRNFVFYNIEITTKTTLYE